MTTADALVLNSLVRVCRKVTTWADAYDYAHQREEICSREEADVITSALVDSKLHAPVLDLDIDHLLVPSGTPGHAHLYLSVPMTWRRYKSLLRALHRAGIIERGFYLAAKNRGYSAVRVPEKPKGTLR